MVRRGEVRIRMSMIFSCSFFQEKLSSTAGSCIRRFYLCLVKADMTNSKMGLMSQPGPLTLHELGHCVSVEAI